MNKQPRESTWRKLLELIPLEELVIVAALVLGTILLGIAAYHYTQSAGEELYKPPGKGAMRFIEASS